METPEPLRWLDGAAFDRALPMSAAIPALAEAFAAAADGQLEAAERQVLVTDLGGGRRSLSLTMSAVWAGRAFGTKVVGFIGDNPARGRPAVQGIAVLIDAATGAPRLITDAGALTVRRTAAMVGLATDRLARPDARVLGLIGTGALAADMIAAVHAVRPLERVVAFNRTPAKVRALAERSPVALDLAADAEEAAAAGDVLVVATSALEPVVADGAIRPGTHVNAVGNFSPVGRELEGRTVGRAAVWVDGVEGALAEAGDLLLAVEEGHLAALPDSLAGDLATLVSGGASPSSRPAAELTLFKSVGTAVADLGALVAAARNAAAGDLGLVLGHG